MNSNLKAKIDKIENIWNSYICEYKECSNQLKFNDDLRTNYFGDILNYFSDTFLVLEKKYESHEFQDNFAHSISFLQAIYIQQDFIEELHFIFSTGIEKGDLKKDLNYATNRRIRNESIGHPIRKKEITDPKNETKNKRVLWSSTLFAWNMNSEVISYQKYQRDTNFKFQKKEYLKIDILQRHYEFLDHNFDIIINKLEGILRHFLKKLENLHDVVIKRKIPIEKLLKFLSHTYESIFKQEHLFAPNNILELSKRENEHPRYENGFNLFYTILEKYLKESIDDIKNRLGDKEIESKFFIPGVKNLFVIKHESITNKAKTKEDYGYELSKLSEKKLGFYVSLLERRCIDNEEAMNEINHLKAHVENDLEYYSAYELLKKILNADSMDKS